MPNSGYSLRQGGTGALHTCVQSVQTPGTGVCISARYCTPTYHIASQPVIVAGSCPGFSRRFVHLLYTASRRVGTDKTAAVSTVSTPPTRTTTMYITN